MGNQFALACVLSVGAGGVAVLFDLDVKHDADDRTHIETYANPY